MTLSTSAQAAAVPDADPTRGAPSTSTAGQRTVLAERLLDGV